MSNAISSKSKPHLRIYVCTLQYLSIYLNVVFKEILQPKSNIVNLCWKSITEVFLKGIVTTLVTFKRQETRNWFFFLLFLHLSDTKMQSDKLLHVANFSTLFICMVLKFPQIFVLMRAKTTVGVSLNSLLLELIGYVNSFVFCLFCSFHDFPGMHPVIWSLASH